MVWLVLWMMVPLWAESNFQQEVDRILEKARLEDSGQEEARAKEIAALGKDHVAALVERLTKEDPLGRLLLVKALGFLGDKAKEAIPGLVQMALLDKDEKVRKAAAQAVHQIYPAADVKFSQALLKSEKEWVRVLAAQAIFNTGSLEIGLIESLLTAQAKDSSKMVREVAGKVLSDLGEKVLPSLIWLLKTQDPDVQKADIQALANLKETSYPYLKKGLTHPKDSELRRLCAQTIGILQADSLVLDLLTVVLQDQEDKVKKAAEKALVQMGEKALPVLAQAMENKNQKVRLITLRILGEIGPKAAPIVSLVLAASSDSDKEIQAAAESAYQKISGLSPTSHESLKKWTADLFSKGFNRRKEAALKVDSLGAKAAPAIPAIVQAIQELPENSDREYRNLLFSVLAKMGPEAVNAIATLTGAQENFATRNAALRTLGMLGPKAKNAVPFLIDSIGYHWRDRKYALAALESITSGNVLPPLIGALSHPNPEVRIGAARALGYLGKKALPAKSDLMKAMQDSDLNVRMAAQTAWNSIQYGEPSK